MSFGENWGVAGSSCPAGHTMGSADLHPECGSCSDMVYRMCGNAAGKCLVPRSAALLASNGMSGGFYGSGSERTEETCRRGAQEGHVVQGGAGQGPLGGGGRGIRRRETGMDNGTAPVQRRCHGKKKGGFMRSMVSECSRHEARAKRAALTAASQWSDERVSRRAAEEAAREYADWADMPHSGNGWSVAT